MPSTFPARIAFIAAIAMPCIVPVLAFMPSTRAWTVAASPAGGVASSPPVNTARCMSQACCCSSAAMRFASSVMASLIGKNPSLMPDSATIWRAMSGVIFMWCDVWQSGP